MTDNHRIQPTDSDALRSNPDIEVSSLAFEDRSDGEANESDDSYRSLSAHFRCISLVESIHEQTDHRTKQL